MQDLQLIGVAQDGEHVLLADEGGAQYRVALDEPLRAATRRDRPRLGQLQIEIDGVMRPREVQALIRSGLSSEEAAQRSGWSIEKVHRFEGPVLAEREFVAARARAVVLGGPAAAKRSGTGDEEDTLASRAYARLKERGVHAEQVTWDAAKLDDGRWSVTADFPAGGKERRASWRFDVQVDSVLPHDDEARWLSADADSLLPAPHVAGGAAGEVFDVAADAGPPNRRRQSESNQPIDLMAAMRDQGSRSRARSAARRAHDAGKPPQPSLLPVDDVPEDALPVQELAGDLGAAPEPPAARAAHPTRSHLDDLGDPQDLDPVLDDTSDASSPQDKPSADSSSRARGSRKPRSGGRPGRASVPSWDDIMFGGRGAKS